MLDWVRATYSDSAVQDKAIITTLEKRGTFGRYNVYLTNVGENVVVFSNQENLLEYIDNNVNSVFAIKLVEEEDVKYSYSIYLGDEPVTVYTIARARVLIPGTLNDERDLHVLGGSIIVE